MATHKDQKVKTCSKRSQRALGQRGGVADLLMGNCIGYIGNIRQECTRLRLCIAIAHLPNV